MAVQNESQRSRKKGSIMRKKEKRQWRVCLIIQDDFSGEKDCEYAVAASKTLKEARLLYDYFLVKMGLTRGRG